MSKFKDGKIFIIIDDDEISTQMLNYSTSKSKETMPGKISGGILKRIVETSEPAHTVFSAYTWYGLNDITEAWGAINED